MTAGFSTSTFIPRRPCYIGYSTGRPSIQGILEYIICTNSAKDTYHKIKPHKLTPLLQKIEKHKNIRIIHHADVHLHGIVGRLKLQVYSPD